MLRGATAEWPLESQERLPRHWYSSKMGRFLLQKHVSMRGCLGSNILPTKSWWVYWLGGFSFVGEKKSCLEAVEVVGNVVMLSGAAGTMAAGKFHLAAIPTGSCPECFTSQAPQLKRKHFSQHMAFILLFPSLSPLFFGLPGPIPSHGLGRHKSPRICLG